MISKAAQRYATSLLQFAVENDILSKVFEDIRDIHNTFVDSDELRRFLKNSIISQKKKKEVLDSLFKSNVQEETNRFISLVVDNDREALFPDIVKSFIDLYYEQKGILEVGVFTARKLSDNQKKDLNDSLNSYTGKTVTLSITENPELMGGLAVRIEDTVIDGTVKHKLDQLKETFFETTV